MSATQPILIAGAGPAGSIAAICLARAGIHVTLIEQHRFPRPKVCGECISALGVSVLRSLDLFSPLVQSGATRFDHAVVHAPKRNSATFELAQPMFGLSRERFDSLLLATATKEPNVQLLQPARCERIRGKDVDVRNLLSNETQTISARLILLADGRAALGGERPRLTGTFGIKTHFRDIAEATKNAIELFSLPNGYGGIAPIEDDRWNISFAVPASLIAKHAGNIACAFASLTERNDALARRMSSARQDGAWLAAPLPRFSVQSSWPENVIPLGNAAAAIEPIGGEGMGLAMRSAQLAAAAVIHSVKNASPVDVRELRRAFRELWRPRALTCRLAGIAASSPRATSLLLPLIDVRQWPAKSFLKRMGKSPLLIDASPAVARPV